MAETINVKDATKDLIWTGVSLVVVYGALLMVTLPALFLFAGGGAENPSNISLAFFYWGFGIAFILAIFSVKIIRRVIAGSSFGRRFSWLDAYGFDSERSPLIKVPFIGRVLKSPLLSVLFAFLFLSAFVVLGSLSQATVFPGSSITDYGVMQQVTETAKIGLSAYPASIAETLSLVVILSIIVSFFRYLVQRKGLPEFVGGVGKFFVAPLLGAGYWLIFHFFRYGGDDTATLSVFLFGLISAYLIVLLGNIVFAIMYHDLNNMFLKSFQLFSSDAVIGAVSALWLVVLVIFIWRFLATKNNASVFS